MNEDKLKNNSSIPKNTLSVFQIAVMTTICVASLLTLPPMAEEGRASILMYIIPAILFLIPTSLVSAEFATTYKGGIYVWIRSNLVTVDTKCCLVSSSTCFCGSCIGFHNKQR